METLSEENLIFHTTVCEKLFAENILGEEGEFGEKS